MLSIVICSINPSFLSDVTENIRSTVGAEFELLVWDNRETKKGLCEVYNLMAEKARFPYICFLHEDILFTTTGWGLYTADLFERDPKLGALGVAGANYKSRMFSGWYSGIPGLDYFNITHRINGHDDKMISVRKDNRTEHSVVCLDGVFICCRKEVWEEVRFDEQLLKGFHFYDIDFSLRVSMKFEIQVTMQIDLVHITKGGDYGDKWIEEAIHYHKNCEVPLPLYLEDTLGGKRTDELELKVAARCLDWLKIHKITFPYKLKWVNAQGLLTKPGLWYSILKFMLYRPLGLKRIHYKARTRTPKIS